MVSSEEIRQMRYKCSEKIPFSQGAALLGIQPSRREKEPGRRRDWEKEVSCLTAVAPEINRGQIIPLCFCIIPQQYSLET